MKRKPTNPILISAINHLRKASKSHNSPIWSELAKDMERAKHSRSTVNISRIVRCLKEGETGVVPGKVLAAGVARKMSVAAFSFTVEAKRKIEDAGGECLSLEALTEKNPKGTGVRIIG